MDRSSETQPGIFSSALTYWRDLALRKGYPAATLALCGALWDFLRDSTPSRLRSRFGDADYDWDHRVNTTSGAVRARDRLLGVLHSPYQPTEPALFHEMVAALGEKANLKFEDFTFVDLGSGKGRTLLMASDFPFRRILGVELLPALHEIARQNLLNYNSDSQKSFSLEALCADATRVTLPDGPLVIYLFNPFPEAGLRRLIAHLTEILSEKARPIYILYHNPRLESVLLESGRFRKIAATHQYSIFSA